MFKKLIKADKTKLYGFIPMIFASFVSASFTWHFSAEKTSFFSAFAIGSVFQLILFSVYDVARKPKRKFLFFVFIFLTLSVMEPIAYVYEQLMLEKADTLLIDYPFFIDWFFESGSYVNFNPGNCCILMIVISLAIGSATYFYTRVYMRISVLFLLALFPPIIYAKDYESYPPLFCTALIVLFFITIIYCNKFTGKDNIQSDNSQKSQYPVSVLSFLATSVLIALIIPKPDIEDKRADFDEFTQGKFSSDYGRVIDNFTTQSNGNNTGNLTSDRELLRVGANELLNLKTQCYYFYDEDKDCWTPLERDEYYMSLDVISVSSFDITTFKKDGLNKYNPAELIEQIVIVCNDNHEFAEKYHLENLIGLSADMGDYADNIYYISVNQSFNPTYILSPENTYSLSITSCPEFAETDIYKSDSGVLYPLAGKDLMRINQQNLVKIEYISPQMIGDKRTQIIMRALQYEDYGEFLLELWNNSHSTVSADAYVEYTSQNEFFEENNERVFSKKIRDLAESITDGLYSDYEKAKAIEQYFTEQGYVYDTAYVCPDGENITDFLFNEQRGSCYHYATAMTLLCRSVGLDARYCEGFSFSEEANGTNYFATDKSYKITESDSHAFCEVYISGYGWMRFEPTVADNGFKLGSVQLAVLIGIILLVVLMLALLTVFVIYPLIQRIYIAHLAKTGQCGKLCRYIINLIKKRINAPQSSSANDIANYIYNCYGYDIMPIASGFDRCIYGEYNIDNENTQRIIDCYYGFRKIRLKSKVKTELEVI